MNNLQYCFERLGNQFQLADVTPHLAKRAVERPGGAINLEYRRSIHADGHDARFMRLVGPKVDVQTLFIYPVASSPLPLFAAETVIIGGKPQIMVLDMPVLALAEGQRLEVRTDMQDLSGECGLASDTDAPDWYQQCRSGYDIFLRQPESNVALAFDDFALAASLKWLDAARSWALIQESDLHEIAIFNYKQHHKEFSPGVPLMSRCFGSAWTADFMAVFFE